MKYFPKIRGLMVLGLIGFYLFWYKPSMRSEFAYRKAMDRVFDAGTDCWERHYAHGEYDVAGHCYDAWSVWQSVNTQPEPGFNWPWVCWRETLPNTQIAK